MAESRDWGVFSLAYYLPPTHHSLAMNSHLLNVGKVLFVYHKFTTQGTLYTYVYTYICRSNVWDMKSKVRVDCDWTKAWRLLGSLIPSIQCVVTICVFT